MLLGTNVTEECLMYFAMPFIQIRKKIGPRTELYGIPAVISISLDASPSTTTCWVLTQRKDLTHPHVSGCTLYMCSLWSSNMEYLNKGEIVRILNQMGSTPIYKKLFSCLTVKTMMKNGRKLYFPCQNLVTFVNKNHPDFETINNMVLCYLYCIVVYVWIHSDVRNEYNKYCTPQHAQ